MMVITSVIVKDLYPVVEKALDKNDTKFRNNIAKFINDRHELLFDIAPYDRIYFNQTDVDNMFKSMGITEAEVINIMKNTFFWDIPYNPQCVKEPYVMTLLMVIRYYLLHSKQKFAELAAIYLAFSGKFYASLHGRQFPYAPPSKYKTVMDYVVNNMLTDKFDLKREGSIFGAIKSLCCTWLDTYGKDLMGKPDDEGLKYLIQQLRDREGAFMKNISNLYYDAFENRNYLNYETDNLDEDAFRLTSNDAATAARITENAVNYIVSNAVSLDIVNKCKDQNVKSLEVKEIIESIVSNNDNLPDIRRVINILICDFMKNNPGKRIGSIDFIAYSIKAKPNTKSEIMIEMKNIILKWLDENSIQYRKRKNRKATQISYVKSVSLYLILVISKVSNNS